jgi:hypothetical protein
MGLEPTTFPRGALSTCVPNLIQLLNRLDHQYMLVLHLSVPIEAVVLLKDIRFKFLTILNLSLRNACHSFPAFSKFPTKAVRL